jgi:hypothetical protein
MALPAARRATTRLAGTCLYASAVTGTVGVVTIIGMFAAFGAGNQLAGERLGFINDVSAFPTLLLAVPAVLETRRLLRPTAPRLTDAITLLALAGTAGVLALQALLVTRALTLERQFPLVMLAYLGLQVWYVAMGLLGSRSGVLPKGGRMGVVAVTYVGYPVWAVWLGRRLRGLAAGEVEPGSVPAVAG